MKLSASTRALENVRVELGDLTRKAQQSEVRSRALFLANPHPMWIFDCETLAICEVNDAALRQYGYTREEFLRLTALDLSPQEGAEQFLALLRAAEDGYGFRGVWQHRRKGGSCIPVEICVSRFQDEGRTKELVLAEDVTAREEGQEALRRSEARLHSLVNGAPFGICTTSLSKDRFEDFNNAACQMLGYSPDELTGLTLSTQVYADARDRVRMIEILQRARKLDAYEITLLRKDGTPIRVRAWGVLRDDDPDKLDVYVQDLTEHSALEQQIRQVQKLEAVGRLAGGIAHDFNNILVVIRLSTELMLSQVSPESQLSKPLLQVLKASDRAAALTRQLLAFGRQQVMQSRVLNLNSVVIDTLHLLRRTIGEDIHVYTQLSDELKNTRIDPDQLTQVIMNLAINARDAMPRGGSLHIETHNVTLDEMYARTHGPVRPGKYVMLVVTDSGTGIEKALLPRIFDPFFTTKEIGKGTGLGLSIVYGVVKQSGGYIWVYSEPGHGTSFKLYFPMTDAEPETAVQPELGSVPNGNSTILVVEDEAQIREQVRDCLCQIGYEVLEASDGLDALTVLHEHEGKVDLVLTDLVMPRMGGYELAMKLERLDLHVNMLYMSGYTEDSAARQELVQKGSAFLTKPFSVADLSGAVQRALTTRAVGAST